MKIRRLGGSGLALSEVTLGTLTWGRDTDEHEAADLLSIYLEHGGRTIDVPSDYMNPDFAGRSQVVGATLKQKIGRDEVAIIGHSGAMTGKDRGPVRGVGDLGPESSRRNLLRSLDHVLEGLETSFVDVWVIHGPRMGVTHQEIVEAAQTAVRSGRAFYIGFAGFDQWDFGALSAMASAAGLPVAGFAGPLSLLAAGALSDQIPHAVEQNSGYIALAPLAHGALTGKYRHATPPDSRAATAHLGKMLDPYLTPESDRVVEAVLRVAEGLDTPPSRVALAWVLSQRGVATAVTGPRTSRQLETLLEGGVLHLQRELREVLTEIALP